MPLGIKGFQKGHGSFWSEETKKKVKENHPRYWLGKKRDVETVEKIRQANKGQHNSPETEFKSIRTHAFDIVGGANSYREIHKWIEEQLGKPETCSKCGKIGYGKQIHWANLSGEYKKEISDWVRVCAKCHYEMDKFYKYGR